MLKEISDGLNLSLLLMMLKNKCGVSSTMDTDVMNSATSLPCHTTATARIKAGPLIMSEEGLVLIHSHGS